jgi:hypothetical protein
MIFPSQSFRKHSLHNKSLFSVEREIFTNKHGEIRARRVIANLRAPVCEVQYALYRIQSGIQSAIT